MIELKITADTPADLRKQLAEILGAPSVPLASSASRLQAHMPNDEANSEPEKARRGRPPKAEAQSVDVATLNVESNQTEAGVVDAEATASEIAEAAVAADDSAITYDTHIKPAILKVSANYGGRDAVLKLLSAFNVDHASKLTEDQWPALLAKVAELEAAA